MDARIAVKIHRTPMKNRRGRDGESGREDFEQKIWMQQRKEAFHLTRSRRVR
jgi:hypothetical protein